MFGRKSELVSSVAKNRRDKKQGDEAYKRFEHDRSPGTEKY